MKGFELSIDVDSLPTWGIQEALRELVQNLIDNDKGYEYSYHNGELRLRNNYTVLPRSVLLVGKSNKRDDCNSRGKHGDGLGSALAIMCREGIDISIINGDEVWTPTRHSESFESDVMFINVEDFYGDDYFEVQVHISQSEYDKLIDHTLPLQENIGNYHQCDEGKILLDSKHVGQIYCGGIWVCNDSNLDYGYDFLPKHLSLDRDRQRVSTFDLQWITKEMWSQVTKSDDVNAVSLVADMVEKRSADTLYLNHSTPNSKVQRELFKRYDEKYSGKVLAKTPQEVIELEASGITNAVFLGNELFTNIVKSSSEYKALTFETKISTVRELMNKFKEEWVGSMSRTMELDYEELTNKVIILAK